jgi:hypothetical protein
MFVDHGSPQARTMSLSGFVEGTPPPVEPVAAVAPVDPPDPSSDPHAANTRAAPATSPPCRSLHREIASALHT